MENGMSVGLLIPLTHTNKLFIPVPYTKIAKPTGATYTNISKPAGGGGTIRVGMTTGLMIPLTYAVAVTITGSGYTKVNKPTGSSYTNIAKPT